MSDNNSALERHQGVIAQIMAENYAASQCETPESTLDYSMARMWMRVINRNAFEFIGTATIH